MAAAEPLEASVACRDGAPNGAFQLRDAAGRLRVVGAFAHGQRTGTFVFWNGRGARVAVIPYDNGDKVGTVALWYTLRDSGVEGKRKLEARYAGGRRHGVTRSWHDNGRPRSEVLYENGAVAEAHAWLRNGAPRAADDAKSQAARDAAADDAVFADLESMIANNLPVCGPNGPRSSATEPASRWPPRAVLTLPDNLR